MSKVETIPLAELVEDMEFYPRHAVDDSNVQSLTLALEAGCELPPLVVDAKSKRIVDGWHRARAHKRVHGAGAVVSVEKRHYKSEADLIEDAIRLNAAHGRRLDVMDQTRAVLMLERYGAPAARIAIVLHMPESRVEKLRVRVATSSAKTTASVPGTKQIALKRSVAHLDGKSLTKAQAEAHEMMPGTSFLLIAKQLRVAIETKLLNLGDEKLFAELKLLNEAIGGLDL